MNANSPSESNVFTSIRAFLSEPITFYTLIVSISISVFIILGGAYPHIVKWTAGMGWYGLQNNFPIFATADDQDFSKGFVEWFGTFYGFLLPLLLLRAWEQLDKADREFDREADSIKVLLEDIELLDDDFLDFKMDMVKDLHDYVRHVLLYYKTEHIDPNAEPKKAGDQLLQGIRAGYKDLIYRGGGAKARRLEPMTTELLERLNEAIDVRGDRISTFSERLFQSLRLVAIITSVIWLIPYYFLPYTQLGVLGALLKLGVTFLIIFVLTIIDDLDGPFTGYWQVSTATWCEVHEETSRSYSTLTEKVRKAQKAKEPANRKNGSQEAPEQIAIVPVKGTLIAKRSRKAKSK